MSVGSADFTQLPCNPELISAGIEFTCRAHLRPFMGRSRVAIAHLHRLCADSIASLALRRWLASETVPHGLAPVAPLTDPHIHLVTIGGRRLQLVNRLISSPGRIRKLGHSPQRLLHAVIAAEDVQATSGRLSLGDLLAFSFLIANICHSYAETKHRSAASEKTILLAIPPRPSWRQQRPWRPLERLILTNSDDDLIDLELCGLMANRNAAVERMIIPAKQSMEINTTWHNLLHLRTSRMPNATLRIQCPPRNKDWFVTPGSWSNLWFYDARLVLAGWLTYREFGRLTNPESGAEHAQQGHHLPRGSAILQVEALRPVQELLQITRHI